MGTKNIAHGLRGDTMYKLGVGVRFEFKTAPGRCNCYRQSVLDTIEDFVRIVTVSCLQSADPGGKFTEVNVGCYPWHD